jgi:hypothetical protein
MNRCGFDVEIPAHTRLALRVAAPPSKVAIPGNEVTVRVVARVGDGRQVLLEASLERGEDLVRGDLPVPAGADRLVFEVEQWKVPPRAPRLRRVSWSDVELSTRARGPLDASRFAIPAEEAVDRYLDAASWPPPEAHSGPRVVVVGIDGASWPLLDELIEAGRMPNLAKLRARGLHGTLESTVVPESAMAWTTIRTGVLPGQHGVMHFLSPDRTRSSYWVWLSEAGRRSVVVGVPKSRTNEAFDGVLVGGWNDSSDQRYATPPALKEALDLAHYDPMLAYIRNVDDYIAKMEERTDIFLGLLEGIDWDHAFVVYEYSDTAAHLFGLHSDQWKRTYAAIDRELGRVIEALPADAAILLVSDHGWKRYAGSVAPIPWLAEHGFEGWAPHLYSGSRFALKTTSKLSPQEEADALARIASELDSLTEPSTGRRLVRRLIAVAEAMPGPFADSTSTRAIVELVPDYHALALSQRRKIVVEKPIEHHDVHGFYLAVWPDGPTGPGPDASVVDVAPTVMAHLDVESPAELPGTSLIDRERKRAPSSSSSPRPRMPSEEEGAEAPPPNEELRRRLRALGYVEE